MLDNFVVEALKGLYEEVRNTTARLRKDPTTPKYIMDSCDFLLNKLNEVFTVLADPEITESTRGELIRKTTQEVIDSHMRFKILVQQGGQEV